MRIKERLFYVTFFGIICYILLMVVFWLLVYLQNRNHFNLQFNKIGMYFMNFRMNYHDSKIFSLIELFLFFGVLFSKYPWKNSKYITFLLLLLSVYISGKVTYSMMPW